MNKKIKKKYKYINLKLKKKNNNLKLKIKKKLCKIILIKNKKKIIIKNNKKKIYLKTIFNLHLLLKHFIIINSHLGFEAKRWNTQIRLFIFGKRHNFHILNLNITILMLKRLFLFLNIILKINKKILFISENKNVDIILKKIIKTSFQYITCNRWLGGIISNIIKLMQNVSSFNIKLKKNILKYEKNRKHKINIILNGLRGLYKIPKLIIILNGIQSKWALNEISQAKIINACLIDSITSINSYNISYPIPSNVYSFSTQIFFCSIFKFNILNSIIKKKLFLKKEIKLNKYERSYT